MSALDTADDLAVSIRVAEPELATRLAALIEQTPGLRIAKPNEPGDLVLSVPDLSEGEPSSRSPHANAMLSPLSPRDSPTRRLDAGSASRPTQPNSTSAA